MTTLQTNPVRAAEQNRSFDFESDPCVPSTFKIIVVRYPSDARSSWYVTIEKSGFDFEELILNKVEQLCPAELESIDVLIVSPSLSVAVHSLELVFQDVENPPQFILLNADSTKTRLKSQQSISDSTLQLSQPFDQSLNAFFVGLRNSCRFTRTQNNFIDQKKAESELQESEERYKLAVAGTKDGIWDMNVATGEIYWSPQLFELLEHEEIDASSSVQLFRSKLHSEDLNLVVETLERHLNEDVPYDIEFRYRLKNGEFCWMHSIGRAVRDSSGKPLRVVGSMRDISDRKLAETALTKSREQYRLLLESLAEGVVVVIEGRIAYTNSMLGKINGYSRVEMKGMAISQFVSQESHDHFNRGYSHVSEGDVLSPEEIQIRTKKGTFIFVEVSSRRILYQGQNALFSIIRDISERKRTDALMRKNRENNAKTSLVLTLTELASGVIHEMSQPLTAITTLSYACVKLLAESPIDSIERKRYSQLLNLIETQSLRAGSIIQNLKKIVLKSSPQITDVDIHQSLRNAFEILNPKFDKHHIEVHMDCEQALPSIRGDIVHIVQIFVNILQNSIDSLSSLPREKAVTINTMALPDRKVIISFSDNGTGIPRKYLRRIFDPFVKSNPEKMGLGLSVCKSIVEAHDGKISARNNKKQGTTISVTFPSTRN